MKIKRYKLKKGTTIEDFKDFGCEEGGKWIHRDAKYIISKQFEVKASHSRFTFTVNVSLTDSPSRWRDVDFVLVTDDEFNQTYFAFYNHMGYNVKDYPLLEKCIKEYNDYMDGFPFLEEKK